MVNTTLLPYCKILHMKTHQARFFQGIVFFANLNDSLTFFVLRKILSPGKSIKGKEALALKASSSN